MRERKATIQLMEFGLHIWKLCFLEEPHMEPNLSRDSCRTCMKLEINANLRNFTGSSFYSSMGPNLSTFWYLRHL